MKHQEDAEQAVVFEWASYYEELRWMHSIPNGAHLAGDKKRRAMQMARMKKQGLKPGVSDIFLPVPMGPFHGLYIEMKRRKVDGPSRVSEDQARFGDFARDQGYAYAVAHGAGSAIDIIEAYMMWPR